MPPELVDPEEAAPHLSTPATPLDEMKPVPTPKGITAALEAAVRNGSMTSSSAPDGGETNGNGGVSPSTPTAIAPSPFTTPRRGHSRQASLGTTMTSPSTRRRSIESTISLIKEAVDGKGKTDEQLEQLADVLSSPTREKKDLWDNNAATASTKPT